MVKYIIMKRYYNFKTTVATFACCLFFSISSIFASTYPNTLIGNEKGLFLLSELSQVQLWNKASVKKIIKTNGWYFLTDNGILYSEDLTTFEYRNNGLPINIIKHFDGKEISFNTKTENLKDLEVNPSNQNILITLTRDQVYITYDGGLNWEKEGFNARSNGAKAVAVCNIPNSQGTSDLTLFMSHSIYGLSYKQPNVDNKWHDITTGFEKMNTLSYADEISDIYTTKNGEVYLTQTFIPRLYKLDWNQKAAIMLVKGEQPQDTWDSLTSLNGNLIFMTPSGLKSYKEETKSITSSFSQSLKDGYARVSSMAQIPLCAWLPATVAGNEKGVSLSELWMTCPQKIESDYATKIANHHSVFVPPSQVSDDAGIARYSTIIKENNLDSIVINMKDDYGGLRYKSTDPEILEKGYVSHYSVDLDKFIPTFKEQGVYLIARIVVFKDKNLWKYNFGKYAVKDSVTGKQWQGLRGYETIELAPSKKLEAQVEKEKKFILQKTNSEKALAGAGFEPTKSAKIPQAPTPVTKKVPSYYDEQWVDPYSEDVWAYNVKIAQELIRLGFDEIQFDYIRFPTDGINLNNAEFTWRDQGMDKEDALISFLSYARENIDAPIGIDIYGANGWYRTGARTGQDVEILSSYVDVICPMFYPSHFEQQFLAYEPAIERPYRVYYYGTYRNSVIARNKALIRPWIQAFYLNCSYDKQYYDDNGDYVRREMFGVRDATQNGYMFWNNSGRYTDLSPCPTTDDIYPWDSYEASIKYKKPALSK
ncbi:MAG: hypothetical protein BKP49_07175 [Treponema sp. CETP13]|nr:MAG: hypothetical protein BKP49_07175 [Treponema sp. CETP13]